MFTFTMNDINQRIVEILLGNKYITYGEVGKKIEKEFGQKMTKENVRDRFRRFASKLNKTPSQLRENAFDETIGENGFEKGTWNHGWLKTDGASIYIVNKKDIVTYDQIRDDFIQQMKKHSPKFKKIKRVRNSEEHLLVIDPADLHIGKLAIESETGNTYNVDKAVQRALEGVHGILNKAKSFGISKIMLVIGNDVLHTDNNKKTTTLGTPQDVSTNWYQAYIAARDMYIEVINHLVKTADVHVVHNPSNHDLTHGTLLADCLSVYFGKHKNITFDVGLKHRKYFEYGNSLIATSHGDGAKEKDLPLIMADESPQMWANTKYRYWYCHHIHHKQKTKWRDGKDYIGVTVEYLRSPSGTDYWHHKNAFLSKKAIEGFIHSKTHGQIARLSHYF